MKKKKNKKTNAMRIVENEKIPYHVHTYKWKEDQSGARPVAEGIQKPMDKIYKTLVTVGDKHGVTVACIPSEKELDLKKLAIVSGNKNVDMLAMKDLEEVTGYIRGGCSPIGMKKQYPTYIDRSAKKKSEIIVSAGKRGVQMELNPLELLEVTNGTFADICND